MDLMQQAQFSLPREASPETGNLDDLHSTFVQNVSHELRTPLSIIQGYAELLRDGSLGALASEQQEVVGIILNRAYELRTLVDRTGILMAIEAHTGVSVPFALAEIIAGVVTSQRAAATSAGITLEPRLEPGLPLVSGDPYHFCSRLLSASSRMHSSSHLVAAGSRYRCTQNPVGSAWR